MNIFWLLLLVHIIADFPLQTDYVFQLKQKKKWGVLLHGLIHFLGSALVFFPFWGDLNLWAGLVVIFVSHVLVDKYKLMLGFTRSAKSFLFFWLDQFTHFLIILLVASQFSNDLEVTFSFPAYQSFFVDVRLLVVLCAFVFVVFGSTFFIYYGRLAWENIQPADKFLTVTFPVFRFRILGYLERIISIAIILFGGNFAALFLVVYLVRIFFFRKKPRDHRYLVVNFIISLVSILWFYWLFYQIYF